MMAGFVPTWRWNGAGRWSQAECPKHPQKVVASRRTVVTNVVEQAPQRLFMRKLKLREKRWSQMPPLTGRERTYGSEVCVIDGKSKFFKRLSTQEFLETILELLSSNAVSDQLVLVTSGMKYSGIEQGKSELMEILGFPLRSSMDSAIGRSNVQKIVTSDEQRNMYLVHRHISILARDLSGWRHLTTPSDLDVKLSKEQLVDVLAISRNVSAMRVRRASSMILKEGSLRNILLQEKHSKAPLLRKKSVIVAKNDILNSKSEIKRSLRLAMYPNPFLETLEVNLPKLRRFLSDLGYSVGETEEIEAMVGKLLPRKSFSENRI